jgi:bifunctional UDP-N-acetylglucosamine pyrophosphorylase/glucosamine-1-phosphate N-acetyltransferase
MQEQLNIVIMAGGLGKRIRSEIPKVLHPIGNLPMLVHVIKTALKLFNGEKVGRIYVIVGKYAPIIQKTLEQHLTPHEMSFIEWTYQPEPLGTGHAVQCVLSQLRSNTAPYSSPKLTGKVLVLSGDVPLIKQETLEQMLQVGSVQTRAVLMASYQEDPKGNGRIIMNNGKFVGIVEEKDCSEEQKLIKYSNSGIYVFDRDALIRELPKIKNDNAQHEYYLPDVLPLIGEVELFQLDEKNLYQLININDPEQLKEAESIYYHSLT